MRTHSIRFAVVLALTSVSIGASAATSSTDLNVSGTLTTACEVTGTPALSFGTLPALSSASDATANTGTGLSVACSPDAAPSIYVTGTRSMSSGGGAPVLIPFNLSLTSGATSNNLASAAGDESLTITQDGTPQVVTIYGRVLTADSVGRPATTYTASLTVSVDY